MTELINSLENTTLDDVSNKKYFKFDIHDDIKKIEKRYKLNLKKYDTQMVIDIFTNGINDKIELKYLNLFDSKNESNQKENGRILNLFGIYLMSTGNIEEAIKYFKNALDLGFTPSANNIGNCYKTIQEFKLAEKYYLKSIDLNELNSYPLLGKLYEKNGYYSKAIEIWLKGLENDYIRCILCLGDYYENNEDYELAKFYYLKGIDFISKDSNSTDSNNMDFDEKYNTNSGELYGKIGYLLWYEFDEYEQSIHYLKIGMELNNSLSYYYYGSLLEETEGNLEFEEINGWEDIVIECYKKSIEINFNIDAIYDLAQIYKKKNEYENMTKILKLGVELNSYDCIGMLANYYEESLFEPDNFEKAIELYSITRENFGCECSLVKIANIYGSSKCNQIDKFISNTMHTANLFNWIGCFELGIYYIKINLLEESKKYLIKALDFYWMRNEDNQEIIFPNQFVHPNDDESFEVDYYMEKYKKIFELKDILETIKSSIDNSLNIIDYIEEIKKIFVKYTDGYYPVLIIILLKGIIDEPRKLLEILKKINNSFTEQLNFMFAIVKSLENKLNHKTILNRIKRAKKNKKYKDCIVCYENKVHIKFDCGHEICCCCYKKMYKCYYNCNISK